MNPAQTGTKAAAHYQLTRGARRVRDASAAPQRRGAGGPTSPGAGPAGPFGRDFDAMMDTRRKEADEFYASVIPASLDADAANVMRQALAGMLWSKQFYYYDVDRWLEEHGAEPFKAAAGAPPPATTTGTTCTTPTSSPCRTSGSTRGTRRGTWPFTVWR